LTRACLLIADAVVDDDRGQGDAAEVGQGVFVVAGGDAAPLLEPVEAAFDGVAVAVGLGVEGGWAPAGGAFALAVGDLVAAFGDGVLDPSFPQVGSRAGVGVGLVRQQALVAGEPVGVGAQQRDQHGIVSGLPGREQHRDRGAQLVGQGVDLGGPPAA